MLKKKNVLILQRHLMRSKVEIRVTEGVRKWSLVHVNVNTKTMSERSDLKTHEPQKP